MATLTRTCRRHASANWPRFLSLRSAPPRPVVAFDLDGTLVDSVKTIAISANDALRKLSCLKVDREDVHVDTVRGFVGDGAVVLFKRMLRYVGDVNGAEDANKVKTAVELFHASYPRAVRESRLYDCVEVGLNAMSRVADLVICTNKPQSLAELHVEIDPILSRHFKGKVAGDLVGQPKKPEVGHLLRALATVNATSPPLIFVGDGPNDAIVCERWKRHLLARGGVAPPITCLLLTYGYGSRVDLENAGSQAEAAAIPVHWASSFPEATDSVMQTLQDTTRSSAATSVKVGG